MLRGAEVSDTAATVTSFDTAVGGVRPRLRGELADDRLDGLHAVGVE